MPISVLSLLFANLIPVFGVLFQGWSLFLILLLYWAESAVTGFFNVMRMAKVGGPKAVAMVPFFLMHYGIFMLVHLIFILTFFGVMTGGLASLEWSAGVALIGLFVSHGVSYWQNFVQAGEFKRTSVDELMMRPYGRILVMHLTIIFGGWVVFSTGGAQWVILVLMGLKTLVDVGAHLAEHGFVSVPVKPNSLVLYVNGQPVLEPEQERAQE